MRICEAAVGNGVFAQAIRPPTVPAGTSRLRLAVMATHKEQELRAAARVLGQVARATSAAAPASTPSPRQRAYDIEAEPEPARAA